MTFQGGGRKERRTCCGTVFGTRHGTNTWYHFGKVDSSYWTWTYDCTTCTRRIFCLLFVQIRLPSLAGRKTCTTNLDSAKGEKAPPPLSPPSSVCHYGHGRLCGRVPSLWDCVRPPRPTRALSGGPYGTTEHHVRRHFDRLCSVGRNSKFTGTKTSTVLGQERTVVYYSSFDAILCDLLT